MISTLQIISTFFAFNFLLFIINKDKNDYYVNSFIYLVYSICFFLLIFINHDLINNDVIDFYEQGLRFDINNLSLDSLLGYLYVLIISLLSNIFRSFDTLFFFLISINSISVNILIRILNKYNVSYQSKVLTLFFIFFNPIFLSILSSGHRELLELLIIFLVIYFILLDKKYISLICISALFMILILVHKVYILFVPIFIIIYFLINFKLDTLYTYGSIFFIIIFSILFYYNSGILLNELDFYNPKTGDREISISNLWQFVEDFRKDARDGSGFPTEFRGARTLYDEPHLNFSFLRISEIYINFLFAPLSSIHKFINNLNILDYIYIIHIFLRIITISIIIFLYKLINKKIFSILIIFIILSSLWSLGTTSYGTAIRHNLVSDFALFITMIILLKKFKF